MECKIEIVFDRELLRIQREEQKEEYHGKFRPSSLGRCYRYQIKQRRQDPITNPIPVKTLRVFWIGKLIHTMLQELFPKECCEVPFSWDDIQGSADLVMDRVWDFKSIKHYPFTLLKKKDFDIRSKLPEVLQTMMYTRAHEKEVGVLVFVDKNTMEFHEIELKLVDWINELHKELSTLRRYWDANLSHDMLPAIKPRAYGGKECGYCVYRDACKSEATDQEMVYFEEKKKKKKEVKSDGVTTERKEQEGPRLF